MAKKARRFLSVLIALTLLLGTIPINVKAAGNEKALSLNEEQGFTVSMEEPSVRFTFTAPEAGTYIIYFTNISRWPIGLQFPDRSTEYHHITGSGDFQGHMMEMAAGESASITFLYPEGELPEDYDGYSGTVGVGKKAETLTGFYALEETDSEGMYSFMMNSQINMNFFTDDPLCYGVTWQVAVEDETILAFDAENSADGGASFCAAFVPKQLGETNISITAVYEGIEVTNQYRIRITETGESGGQQCFDFASFEELKEMVSSFEGDFHYIGTEPLEFAEDIEINGNIYVPYSVEITGAEHILFVQEWQRLEIEAMADSVSSFIDILDTMNETHIDHEHVRYNISVQSPDSGNPSEWILEQSILIPSYVSVGIGNVSSFTIAEGVTITLEGALQIHSPFILEGSLINNGQLVISLMDEESGKLNMKNGQYSGSGNLQIMADAGKQLSDILSNPNDFDVFEEWKNENCIIWDLKYAAGLIQLGTPTELSWGIRYDYAGEAGYTVTSQPGIMSWKTEVPDQARAQVKIYNTLNECVFSTEVGFDPQEQPEYRSLEDFLLCDLDSGTYYYTVRSLGDYETYRSSDIAVSDTYTYIKPAVQLNPCTELYWNDRNGQYVSWAHFTLPENEIETVGFELAFYYSPEEEGEYERLGGMSSISPYGIPDNEMPLEDIFLQQKGVGYYKFRVRIISPFIEEYCSSEWSDFSPALDVQTIPDDINSSLDQLLQDPGLAAASPSDIRQAVQKLDTMDLKTALLTDQDNTETTAKLADLENMAGGPASVTVTAAASAFNASQVSIVGANLNYNVSENPDENPLTLILDKPAANHVIPERYDSAVAVSFSMTLSNVEDAENLKVPVKITLPVPDSINPDFLVILHYHENGEVELLEPYVYEVDGEFFADFVLTGFSDFIMTQLAEQGEEHVHVYDQEAVEDCYLKTPADCENAAVYYKSCRCGEKGTETFEYGVPESHSFSGENGTVCTKCGFRRYTVTSGTSQTYYKGCTLGLIFQSEACCLKLVSVEVDHEVIDPKNYIAGFGFRPIGSAVVMLKASYLNTLDTGDHVITFVFEDGEAETVFAVSQRENRPNHKEQPSWPNWPGRK